MTHPHQFMEMILYESVYDIPQWLFPYYLKYCGKPLNREKTLEQNLIQIIVACIGDNIGLSHHLWRLYASLKNMNVDKIAESQGPMYIISSLSTNDIKMRNRLRAMNGTLKERCYETNNEKIFELVYDEYVKGKYRYSNSKILKAYYNCLDNPINIFDIDKRFVDVIYPVLDKSKRKEIDDYSRRYNLTTAKDARVSLR